MVVVVDGVVALDQNGKGDTTVGTAVEGTDDDDGDVYVIVDSVVCDGTVIAAAGVSEDVVGAEEERVVDDVVVDDVVEVVLRD